MLLRQLSYAIKTQRKLESATSSLTSSEPLWCEDYTKLQIPVLLFGGWHDGYTNAAFRLAEKLPNCRTVVGPWSHNWPDTAVPGPNLAYLDECLQFWTEHLKQGDISRLSLVQLLHYCALIGRGLHSDEIFSLLP